MAKQEDTATATAMLFAWQSRSRRNESRSPSDPAQVCRAAATFPCPPQPMWLQPSQARVPTLMNKLSATAIGCESHLLPLQAPPVTSLQKAFPSAALVVTASLGASRYTFKLFLLFPPW